MRGMMLATAVLGSSGSAGAVTYVGEIRGSVTASFATPFTAEDAPKTIQVGDAMIARFTWIDPATDGAGGPLGAMMGRRLAAMATDQASFELGDHVWTSRGSFLGGLVPPTFGPVDDPFRDLFLTMDNAPGAGDLDVAGYRFEIGEFGYELYQGWGYAGAFDRATLRVWADGVQVIGGPSAQALPVPEPASWALMIAGFALAGAALRRTTARALA